MEDRKVGLSIFEWIISILGIIVLVMLIVLPPIFRTVFKEEKLPETPNVVLDLDEVTCSKDLVDDSNNKITDNYVFKTHLNQVKIYSNKTTIRYDDVVLYQGDKIRYGHLVTAFSVIAGYKYNVEPNDDESTLIIDEEYDLAIFSPTTVTVPGDSDATNVASDYALSQNMVQIRQELETNGYLCK